ncbi:MAG: DUF1704 domain-containing protein, partial [bacterium]|nr:DUF1704 domain-containing protein [bacterium]
KQIYRWKINEKLAQLGMMKAAAEGNMRRFERYNGFVYGEPDEDIFAFSVGRIREDASKNPDLAWAAKDLLETYPKIENLDVSLPSEETINYVREVTKRELSKITEIEPFEGKIDAEQIVEIFNRVIGKLGLQDEWRVVVENTSRTGISINQEEKAAKIPQSRELTQKSLEGLIAHEISTHVQRRINGEGSKLKLLGLGLDRYLTGEEGVATMRQQVIGQENIDEFAGLDYHLGISFARGLDGEKRDFRGVFEVLEKKNYFYNLKKGQGKDKAKQMARNTAYNSCVRIFRGTDCKTKGVCFSKDLVYREGNIGVFMLISTQEGKQEMLRFSIGKYDPTNERHIWILNQLGITDEDLSGVENFS